MPIGFFIDKDVLAVQKDPNIFSSFPNLSVDSSDFVVFIAWFDNFSLDSLFILCTYFVHTEQTASKLPAIILAFRSQSP